MFGNVVKLVFQSASIGSGLDDFIKKTEAGLKNSNMLGQGVARLSTIFGGLGTSIGGAVDQKQRFPIQSRTGTVNLMQQTNVPTTSASFQCQGSRSRGDSLVTHTFPYMSSSTNVR